MPSKGVQQEIMESNPSRINVKVAIDTGGAKQERELPYRVMVLGDFTGRPVVRKNKKGYDEMVPIDERTPVNVNKDNFDAVMKAQDVSAEFTAMLPKADGQAEGRVSLRFESLKAFHPEAVARQVPEILRLVAARILLQDLRNRVVNVDDFRKQLDQIISDPATRQQLASELEHIMAPRIPARAEADINLASSAGGESQ